MYRWFFYILIAAAIAWRFFGMRSVKLGSALDLVAIAVIVTIVAIIAVSRWQFHRRLRRLGFEPWRIAVFSNSLVPNSVLRWRARGLDKESLLGAWHLPEHTSRAKAIIAEELATRGVMAAQLAAFIPSATRTRVPPGCEHAVPPAQYAAMVSRRQRLFGAFRWLAGVVCLLYAVQFTIGDNRKLEEDKPEAAKAAGTKTAAPSNSTTKTSEPANGGTVTTPPPPAASEAVKPPQPTKAKDTRPIETISPDSRLNPKNLPPHLQWIGRTLEAIVGYVFPLAVAGFFLVAGITTWRDRDRALRVVLLRPFGEAKMTKAIKKMVLRNLGPQGHVYTLEDRYFKPNPLITLMSGALGYLKYATGPILRSPMRLATVKSENTYLKLALKLTNRWTSSFRSFMFGGQAFNIRCTDPWWQSTIDLLLNSSDIIVMDVSRVGPGSAWEIDRIEARGVLPKCLFIVQQGHEGEGHAGIARVLDTAPIPQLFAYDEYGAFEAAGGFEAALLAHVKSALATWDKPAPTAPRVSTQSALPA
jgi:hypothetical protein